jgi:tyrosine-protein kinase Etk/Wzc
MSSNSSGRGPQRSSSHASSQPVVADGEGLDLQEIAAILWAGKWIIAAITAVVLALFLIYAFLATPIYQASALVQIQQQQNRQIGGADAGMLSMLFPIAAPTQAEIAIMKSRSVLEPTVEKEHLNILIDGGDVPYSSTSGEPEVAIKRLEVPPLWVDKELELTAKNGGRYTLASPDDDKVLEGQTGREANAMNGKVKIFVSRLNAPAGKSFSIKRLYDQKAIKSLDNRFGAGEKGQGLNRQETGIIALTLEGAHPVRVKDTLNTLVNQYMKQNVAAQAAQAHQSLAFINKQLPKVKHTLDKAQGELAEYRTKKGVVNLDEQARSLLRNLTSLESQKTQIKLTQSSMNQRFTGNYPGLQALRSQKQDVKQQIDTVKAQINNLPSKEKDYVGLLQKAQVYQQLYRALLSKSQDLQISQAATTGSARVVDYAITPIKPIKPRKALIGGLGLVLGLLLGMLFVFLRHAFTRAIQDATELEQEFVQPVYAVVPHSERQASVAKRARRERRKLLPLLAAVDPGDPAVEAIRSLRTSITFALKDAQRKIVTMGGCTPGIGKSFLSINLAHIIGAGNARVLLIDADLRRGHLEKYMTGQKQPGLSQLLSGEARLEEAIQRNPHRDGVDFLPSGPFPPDPYELVSAPLLEEIVNGCADEYDYVVIDVPPILSVAEGLVIGRLATANFLIVKAGEQTLQELRIAVDRMRQNGINLEGFVFNDLSRQAATYTYGRYASRYYARYGQKPSK